MLCKLNVIFLKGKCLYFNWGGDDGIFGDKFWWDFVYWEIFDYWDWIECKFEKVFVYMLFLVIVVMY